MNKITKVTIVYVVVITLILTITNWLFGVDWNPAHLDAGSKTFFMAFFSVISVFYGVLLVVIILDYDV